MSSPIGGSLISSFGGLIGVTPFQANRTVEFGGAPPTTANGASVYFDTKKWELEIIEHFDDITGTGHFGADGNAKTGEGFRLSADLVWNTDEPPDELLKYGLLAKNVPAGNKGTEVKTWNFDLGVRMQFLIGDDASWPEDEQRQFYYAPSVKRGTTRVICDPNGRKMVGCHIEAVGNSRLFKLPVEYTQLQRYITHLSAWDWVF